MAHSGGKIYVDTSVTPNIGISIADIKAVLGSPRHPVTGKEINDIGGLITYGDINIWAKYKPVRINSMKHPNANWWKADDGNCGLQAYGAHNYANLASVIDGSDDLKGWIYYHPLGASAFTPSWFRFLDFDGYNHQAGGPVVDYSLERDRLSPGEDISLVIPVNQDGTDSLTPSDIMIDGTAMSALYLGAFVKLQSSGTIKAVKAAATLAAGSGRLTISTTGWAYGTYKIYPFLSTVPIAQTSQFTGEGEFYTIPFISAQEFEIGNYSSHSLILPGATLLSTRKIEFPFTFSGATVGATLQMLTVKLRDPAKAYNDTIIRDPVYDYFERAWTLSNTVTVSTTQAIYTSSDGLLKLTVSFNTSTLIVSCSGEIPVTDGMAAKIAADPTYRPALWVSFKYSADGGTYTESTQVAVPQS